MTTIADVLPDSSPDVPALYMHIPFCFHKCHYCDFYSIVDRQDRQAAFTHRLINNLYAAKPYVSKPIQTIFIGGGTPTLLASHLWRELLAALDDSIHRDASTEFTVEANPETVTDELAAILREGGVNRISIGAQSFNTEHLKTLERWHEPPSVPRAVQAFRNAGIDNINLDLIYGIPNQTIVDWQRDLDAALELQPSHFSCYALTYEPNTPMTARLDAGRITALDDDLVAAMFEHTQCALAAAGYEHYEISNWAQPGRRCAHNLIYWTNRNWWPVGPSASGHVNGLRWKNIPRLDEYIDGGGESGLPRIIDVETPDAARNASEQLMLGLRLIDGIALEEVDAILRVSGREETLRATIEKHIETGLLVTSNNHLHLTPRGIFLADTVIGEMI
jgi:oxygen-independent coproporphyrinogen-3 oxidase